MVVRTPVVFCRTHHARGPRKPSGLVEPSLSFMVGQQCVSEKGGTGIPPCRPPLSEHHPGRRGGHQQADSAASAAMLLAGYQGARRGLSTSARAAGLLGTAFGRMWITP